MPRTTTLVETALPLDLPTPYAQPSGDIYQTQQPYTLPLNQRVALARVIGPYTEIDRKLWATLVAHAWDKLATVRVHEANARDIARLFRELKGGQSGSGWVMASAKRLMASQLEWEDDAEVGAVSLLSGLKIQKVSGTIQYQFSNFLIEKLRDNKQFSRLRLHFMIGLSGKYSVTLYMLLESAANRRVPAIEVSIEELRTVLSVSDGKLTRWVDLNRFAIEPALRQINDNPNASGFSVEVETVSKGRKIERVRFKVTKAAERVLDEAELKLRISHREADEAKTAERPTVPAYQLDAALTIVRREASGFDAYAILAEFDRWLKTAKEPVKNTLGALTQFARAKRKEWGGPLFEGRTD
jgi:hypothetical protein